MTPKLVSKPQEVSLLEEIENVFRYKLQNAFDLGSEDEATDWYLFIFLYTLFP